ncbi:MAG TPA: ROK family protein, partial [Candidatus Saccharimonadaceae bacterium]|nr:ROK family protein [Candidatus Saccharimonadaceae bacterium]
KVEKSVKFPTPATTDHYVAQLRSVISTSFAGHDVSCVVVAIPGVIKNGVALWCANLGWRDFNVADALKGLYGDAPIIVENDANLAGLAAAHSLHPMPVSVLYATISTGIGSGIITNGKIDPGLRLSEIGHTPIEYDGRIQEWEKFASGRAIHEIYSKFAADITSHAVWKQIADRISRGFLAIIPTLQPDVIVIGGSIGTYFGRYAPELESLLIEHLPAHIPCPRLVQAAHPEQAVIYGGYYYARDLATQ